MKQKCNSILLAIFVLLITLAQSNMIISAQSGGMYDLAWNTIDGSAESVGGGYRLFGTIGQSDAGVELDGGDYTLIGGFWNDSLINNFKKVYLPIILR